MSDCLMMLESIDITSLLGVDSIFGPIALDSYRHGVHKVASKFFLSSNLD